MSRRTTTLAVVLAIAAALIAPLAQAAGSYPDAFERAVAQHAKPLNELALSARMAGPSFGSSSVPASYPDAFERAVAAHQAGVLGATPAPGRAAPDILPPAGSPTFAVAGGFDWSSAAIGGSATLAVILLVAGASLTTRHGRGRVALR